MLTIHEITKAYEPLKKIPANIKDKFNIHIETKKPGETFSGQLRTFLVIETGKGQIKVDVKKIKSISASDVTCDININEYSGIYLGISGSVTVLIQ